MKTELDKLIEGLQAARELKALPVLAEKSGVNRRTIDRILGGANPSYRTMMLLQAGLKTMKVRVAK